MGVHTALPGHANSNYTAMRHIYKPSQTYCPDQLANLHLSYIQILVVHLKMLLVTYTFHFTFSGVTEEQFKESWTRPGTTDLNEGNVMIAKARM